MAVKLVLCNDQGLTFLYRMLIYCVMGLKVATFWSRLKLSYVDFIVEQSQNVYYIIFIFLQL